MNKKIFLLIIVVVSLFVTGCTQPVTKEFTNNLTVPEKTVTLFKSPECGCCTNYASYLKSQ